MSAHVTHVDFPCFGPHTTCYICQAIGADTIGIFRVEGHFLCFTHFESTYFLLPQLCAVCSQPLYVRYNLTHCPSIVPQTNTNSALHVIIENPPPVVEISNAVTVSSTSSSSASDSTSNSSGYSAIDSPSTTNANL